MKKLTNIQINLINKKIVLNENKNIVLLDMTGSKNASELECNANIYCVDNDYNILWHVSDSKGTFNRDSFVYLELDSDGGLLAKRFFGKKYIINITNGFAQEIGWDK